MFDYEKLGAFYLGREFDADDREVQPEYVMYDSKDLSTHAVIVGMTGSGKTGLGVTLLEEAAIDGIPALIIDPKGDMGNLRLNFPDLKPNDFKPWIEEDAAARKAMTVDEYATDRAKLWKNGLANWEQSPERIQKLKDAADVVIYTPGSDAGIPLSVLKSMNAPSPEVRASSDAMRERVATSVSGLLALLGIDADPIRSREHILLSNILDQTWREGKNLDLPGLIHAIQTPPFNKIGIMDMETIFPAKDRLELAMTINNILASPSFEIWTQGEPLNIQKLLYSDEGKPQLAVLSIAHLSDQERMFFVTLLLNEVVAWMRSQSGTSSLRALLYMDEVFGYLPPTANPPSKLPMLTLLKQARAFGLGLVLSTQNPVDLDYKALSNAGTWFLGRLQTERDQLRVLDGLEGASSTAGIQFDRKKIEQILSGVGSRVFLMNNVHEDQPVLFHTRWALSYLSGPMTRAQIAKLKETDPKAKQLAETQALRPQVAPPAPPKVEKFGSDKPVLPTEVPQKFLAISRKTPRDAAIAYRPALLGVGALHYVDSKSDVDSWSEFSGVVILDGSEKVPRDPWDDLLHVAEEDLDFDAQPHEEAGYLESPGELARKTFYRSWGSSLKSHLYRECRLSLRHCPDLKLYSRPEDREGDFLARLHQLARETRDLNVAKLRKKYATKFERLKERIRKANDRLAEEKEQANSASVSAVVSFGTSILGALFSRKKFSSTNVSRAGTSMRSASRAANQRGDVSRAEAEVEKLKTELEELEKELESETAMIQDEFSEDQLEIETYEVKPRKSDISVEPIAVLWMPYQKTDDGILQEAFDRWEAEPTSSTN